MTEERGVRFNQDTLLSLRSIQFIQSTSLRPWLSDETGRHGRSLRP